MPRSSYETRSCGLLFLLLLLMMMMMTTMMIIMTNDNDNDDDDDDGHDVYDDERIEMTTMGMTVAVGIVMT